jgi:hypothetical protein
VARDRPCPVGDEAELDELRRAVLLRRAVERELVGGRPEFGRGQLVERACVADLALRDRREGDVLLEERRDARPLGVPPAEDELVVGELEEEVGARGGGGRHRLAARSRASRSFTFSE